MESIDKHIQRYLSTLLNAGASTLEIKLISMVIEAFLKEQGGSKITKKKAHDFIDKYFSDASGYYLHEHLIFFVGLVEENK